MSSEQDKGKDVFRDTPLRYLGYSNELGEAFRPLVRKSMVRLSYGIAFGYVFSDTIHKGYLAWHLKADHPSRLRKYLVAEQSLDTLLWQTFASVLIPGFVIHKCVDVSKFLLERVPLRSQALRSMGPTGVGLLMIPVIIHPIDHLVELVMNEYYRPWRSGAYSK